VAITLVTSSTFAFADGNTGHSCNLGSSPAVGDLDLLCVNSDTVVSTPAGFTARRSDVTNQGAYIFSRKAAGGEGSTVTVTTSGNFNAVVSWSRWSATNTFDVSAGTQANSSSGASTPAHSTGTLAASTDLVVAFGALHSSTGATAPSWSTGFTGLTEASQGTGSTGCFAFVGYKIGAGTAAETPQVSWTGSVSDRYMLTAAFTAAAGGTTTPISVSGSLTPAGAVVRQIGKRPAGSLTPTGIVARQARRLLAGTLTPTAAVAKQVGKRPAGAVTPAAAVAIVKAALRTFTGSITPAAAVAKQAGKALSGAVAPAGTVRRLVVKTVVGTLATAGLLLKQARRTYSGTIAPTGQVARQVTGVGGGVQRPFTGTAVRPDAGTVHRPNTGIVTRP
jgi:hypothetical protein